MNFLEFAVTQFSDFDASGLLVGDLQDVYNFSAGIWFVVDDFRFEVDHALKYNCWYRQNRVT